jgi:riboflavin kinase / FMN adenylyltransferase
MIKYQIYSKTQNTELQKPCVATIGKFDGVHLGHQKLLNMVMQKAFELNLVPTVITFEPHPREYFSSEIKFRRLHTLEEKIKSILNLGIAQVIVLDFNEFLEELTAQEFFQEVIIDQLSVKSMLVGDDFRFGKAQHCGIECLTELCTKHKIELQIVDKVHKDGKPISSSRMRQEKYGE